jgi:hypothetical protein
VIAVSAVAPVTDTPLAAAPPNVTVVPAAKFVPEIVTDVPPAVGPDGGLTRLTVGETRVKVMEIAWEFTPLVPTRLKG